MDTQISLVALTVSFISLGLSFYFWRLQFRPIITVAVKTVQSGNIATVYNLNVKNSGTVPAKNIKISFDKSDLKNALGKKASEDNLNLWVRAINMTSIHLLQNDDTAACSFGFSEDNGNGFWKYGAEVSMLLEYDGWFGFSYTENQIIKIQDSESFTGHSWNANI